MPHPGTASFGSLRSRKVDWKKPLPVLRWSECLDLDETASLNRAIPAMATGVEKEEEEEHHLQAALHANQAGVTQTSVVIPTPDASQLFPDHDKYYTPTFSLPKSLIKFSAQIEDCVACPYCMDEVDDEWLTDYRNKCTAGSDGLTADDTLDETLFEILVYGMEQCASERFPVNPPSLENVATYLADQIPHIKYPSKCLPSLYEHWKRRRYSLPDGSALHYGIMPALKLEELGPKSESDPYVCFRRREIRPVRKAKRTDLASLEKLRRLRDELCRARSILELVSHREQLRRESLFLEKHIFEQRVLVRRLKKKLGLSTTEKELEMSPEQRKKKKKISSHEEQRLGTKIKIPLQKLKDAAVFVGELAEPRLLSEHQLIVMNEMSGYDAEVKKRKLMDEKDGWIDATEDPTLAWGDLNEDSDTWARDYPISLVLRGETAPKPARMPFARRRMGRGGRILVDRHVRSRDWLGDRPFADLSSGSLLDDSDGDSETEGSARYWKRMRQRWRYDLSDDDAEDEFVLMEDTARNIAYRAFSLAPNQEDVYSLMTKPAFPDQLNPKPTSDFSQRSTLYPPPQVIRTPSQQQHQTPAGVPPSSSSASVGQSGAPNPQTATKKPRQPKPGDPSKASASTKKKQAAPIDERQAAVKRMMQEAAEKAQLQRQAARPQSGSPANTPSQNSSALNQQANAANHINSPSMGQNQKHAGSATPTNSGGKPIPMSPLASQGIPNTSVINQNMQAGLSPNIASMIPNASQQLRLQQLRLQQQLNQQANLNNLAAQLTPQQLLFYQQQQMLAAAGGANVANAAAMQHLLQRRLGMLNNAAANQAAFNLGGQLPQMQLSQLQLSQLALAQAQAQAQAQGGNKLPANVQQAALLQQLLAKQNGTQVSGGVPSLPGQKSEAGASAGEDVGNGGTS
ncbi:Enhancer of polycomb-like protein 1 [Chytridiales sp. JEL 0842]|nr:Enhancer of polycomb-like protein 1 [Chytridiales sp. JEL 0842]